MAISSPRNVTPVKVREPNGLGEPLVHQLLHGLPGVEVVAVHVGAVVALVSQREHRVLAVVRREAAVRAESANLSCKLYPSYRELFGQMSISRHVIGCYLCWAPPGASGSRRSRCSPAGDPPESS